MRLFGNMLKNAMMYNYFSTKDGTLRIHNSDDDGYGIISSYSLDDIENDVSFVLSKKDYQTLSGFDEFILEVKEQKVNVKTTNGKITFTNMKDVHEPELNMKDAYELKINVDDFLEGRKFVGNDQTKIYLNGCNIASDGYFISDLKCGFIHYVDIGIEEPLCLPKESFKYIAGKNSCMTDGKMIAFMSPGNLFYTNLIAKATPIPKFDFSETVSILVKKRELMHNLSLLKNYTEHMKVSFHDDSLHLCANEENYDFDFEVAGEMIIGNNLSNYGIVIGQFMKILELFSDEDIVIHFNERLCFSRKDDVIGMMARFSTQGKTEVE